MTSIRKIVVLGANGVMGSGAAAVFAMAGIPTVMLARTTAKAGAGRARAEQLAKRPLPAIEIGSYQDDLVQAVAGADLVFEALTEDLETKRDMLAWIDQMHLPHMIVATVSSGLSISALCETCSEQLRHNFLGIHLFNPPTVIRGCEIIPHRDSDPAVVDAVRELLESVLDRVVIEATDTPAFAGNRIGFKVLNEVAQLAEEHGVAYMDQLVGAHTGRALAPLATIDLVGWDVHKAIVDNLWRHTDDQAHPTFELPAYMQRGIDAGHLGRKTRDKGGFFRVDGKGDQAVHFVLDPATGSYQPLAEVMPPLPVFVERMKVALRRGDASGAFDVLIRADGKDAALLRRVVLGYISYALDRVGEVVACAGDVDRIMGFGFNWAPPSVLVDAIGPARTVSLLEDAGLPIPAVIAAAASAGQPMCDASAADSARFFAAA